VHIVKLHFDCTKTYKRNILALYHQNTGRQIGDLCSYFSCQFFSLTMVTKTVAAWSTAFDSVLSYFTNEKTKVEKPSFFRFVTTLLVHKEFN